MIRFLAHRLMRAGFVLLGVSVLAFILLDLAPGEYFQEMRLNPQIGRETVAALRVEYGLDQPLPLRYLRWVRSVSRGELGYSFAYNRPVWPLLETRIGNTLILTVTALVCSWLIAIPLGVWMASRAGRWEDRVLGASNTFLLATPDVLVALGLLAFALRVGWLPTGGMHAPVSNGDMKDLVLHLILPVLALVAATLPILVRHVRSAMLEVLYAPFIAAARGHGIPRLRLLFGHALPAAANPLLSLFGISVGMLLGVSLLVEVVMGWPGVGPLLLQAILERDPHIVVAAALFSTLFLMAGSVLADTLLYIADPRIRVDS
ncbi:MAG TPA: ABC transporter permease [Candidatus Angelobacter sp.]|nr:ABC transporter permease [Candidatus Angelobacter sp.]